jgi:uncharacterized protein (DUF1697 family)
MVLSGRPPMGARTFVALFSGINVGGKRIVGMADLRSMLEDLGFDEVATYVQSGNAVFRTGSQAGPIAAAVEEKFEKRFGFFSRVMVRDLAWLRKLVAKNPFEGAAEDPRQLHAYVLQRAPGRDGIARLARENTGTERFHVREDALYLLTPDGFGRSKFAALLPARLEVPATARNWRTVTSLLAIAEAAERAGAAP